MIMNKIINKIREIPNSIWRNINKKSEVEIDGHHFYLDNKDSLGLSLNKDYEPEVTKCMKENIKEGDIVVDIGANIGVHTILMAKLVGKEGKVYAFEPDITNFKLLKKNVEVNNYKNIVLVNKAVSDRNDKIKLYLCKNNNATHRTYNSRNVSGKFNGKYVEIDCIKLDNYFEDKEKPNFIKIDIEGSEPKVMMGATKLLSENTIKILTEFYPLLIQESGCSSEKYISDLLDLGYTIYNLDSGSSQYKNMLCIKK